MRKIALAVLIWTLAACTAQRDKTASVAKDPYAALWQMLAVSSAPSTKPLNEINDKAAFKDASHSTGKGKIAVGTA
ncbi:MAG: hypothetical protein L7F77_04050 [Candidatus Magnetominusculus sp. LBB02]|nr:hypothetical protein [Candidatus Magnetominusculus sp. LBB02]